MGKVITFGEIMMRLNPSAYLRFVQADSFEASYAGGEANVAVSLANYGRDAWFVTKLPDTDIGQCAVNALRRYGVQTGGIVRGGPRIGIYFLENGDPVNALASFSYGHAWLDAGAKLGVFAVDDETLFTI